MATNHSRWFPLLAIVALAGTLVCVRTSGAQGLMQVDLKALVGRADLDYDKPASRSEEGQPLGNGKMGSLVWTTPGAIKFQINRVDVFAENCETNSFIERFSDYASGCAYVDIDVSDGGDDVFAGGDFRQKLSVYDGLMTLKGKGVSARLIAWPRRDVMAVEIEDQRDQPAPVHVDLSMLRYVVPYLPGQNWKLTQDHASEFVNRSHTATSKLDIRGDRIILSQQFREGTYYNASAVAAAVVGRPAKARYLNNTTVQLTAQAGKGKFVILISSASTFNARQDVGALALAEVDAASQRATFEALAGETAQWWHDFWSRGFVHLHSADGRADLAEQNYTYFLYLMGASSRGNYPPRFGGMIWYTNGDMRAWGSQYWWANTSAYYRGLMPANRLELSDPVFTMYFGLYDSAARAARQEWGSQGIYIPETVWFDGLENLPDAIAAEMRDLYLVRKAWAQRSQQFIDYASTKSQASSRWNWFSNRPRYENGHWIPGDKGQGPFGHTSHILGVAGRIAGYFWERYEYTLDTDFLKNRAYPMLKGSAEFYRNFPNVQKGADGKYHILHVNNGESNWNTNDTAYELGVMHAVFPLALKAAKILNVDADLQPKWQELLDNLTPAPAGGRGGMFSGGGFGGFTAGSAGAGAATNASPEEQLKARFVGFRATGGFIDTGGSGGAQIFRNRLRLREGPGAIDAEHLGGLTSGIHASLLSSNPAAPGADSVITVFPSYPKDWEAQFQLLARGGFLVSSAQVQGKAAFVDVLSQLGGQCRLQNPWGDQAQVTLTRSDQKTETLSGATLNFATVKGEQLRLVLQGATPAPVKVPG